MQAVVRLLPKFMLERLRGQPQIAQISRIGVQRESARSAVPGRTLPAHPTTAVHRAVSRKTGTLKVRDAIASSAAMHVVEIDLAGIRSTNQLLAHLGSELELGGPAGNHKTRAGEERAGWGLNWSALKDSLCYLDSGGIWGTSTRLPFPLTLRFVNHDAFEYACPQEFATLVSILEDVRSIYRRSGLDFGFQFDA